MGSFGAVTSNRSTDVEFEVVLMNEPWAIAGSTVCMRRSPALLFGQKDSLKFYKRGLITIELGEVQTIFSHITGNIKARAGSHFLLEADAER